MERLNSLQDMETSAMAYEHSAAKVGAFLRLKRYDEAIELARATTLAAKEGRRFELLGLAYRESGRLCPAAAYADCIGRGASQHAGDGIRLDRTW